MSKTPKSWLFVPATHPNRFAKAAHSGACAYIIDLEDSVGADDKPHARHQIIEYEHSTPKPYWVRLNNDHDTHHHTQADLTMLQACQHLAGVVVPKVERAADIERVADRLGVPVVGVIETALGVHQMAHIATAQGLLALGFGVLDLSHGLGVAVGYRAFFDQIRHQMVLHSALCGLARPIETIFAHIDDTQSLIESARHAYQMGFGGQFAIHPSQIEPIKQSYTPHPTTQAFAQAVLSHYQKTGETVFVVDGHMVDLPVIEWARRSC